MINFIPQNIEQLVLEANLITGEQLKEFKENLNTLSFYTYLVENLKIDQEKLLDLFSHAFSLKKITIFDEQNIDMDLLSKINIKFLRDNSMILIKELTKNNYLKI